MFIANPIGDAMNNTEWAFPLAECFHIAAFALSIGTIAVVDLRLLGLGIKKQTAAQLMEDTQMWTIIGLAVVIVAGFFIFLSQPDIYLNNAAFLYKVLVFLPLGILFNFTVHRRVVLKGSQTAGVIAAVISLVIWTATVFGGLFIAFV